MKRVDDVVADFAAGRIRLDDVRRILAPQEWILFRQRIYVDALLISDGLPHVDREAVLDLIELLARLLVDDGAQHGIVDDVRRYRLRERGDVQAALAVLDALPDPGGDPAAAEEEALEELREMRRQEAAERDALVAAVRDDLLAGRIGRQEAVERVGLNGWSAICASLDVEVLRKILEDDQ